MLRTPKSLAVLSAVLMSAAACRQASSAGEPRGDPSTKERKAFESDSIPRGLAIGGTRIPLDSLVDFSAVQQVLGPVTTSVHRPRFPGRDEPADHDEVDSICYHGSSTGSNYSLALLSDEMGGPGHRVLGFELELSRSSTPGHTCNGVLPGSVDVFSDNGLYLGMQLTDAKRILGQPTHETDTRVIYERSHSRTSSEGRGGAYDEYSLVHLDVAKGVVMRIFVWLVSTV